jgi:hypothetical protein
LGDIVNLRRARKQLQRQKTEKAAHENRALHSVPARERKKAKADTTLLNKRIEAARREPNSGNA